MQELETIFSLWQEFLDGSMSQADLIMEFKSIKARFARMLKAGERSEDSKARNFCTNLLKAWPAMWTFLNHQGTVEPTNNRAERALRPAVSWRKISFGVQSQRGGLFVDRRLTTVTSLRQQGRVVLDFLEYALIAFRKGVLGPTLIPEPSG